MNKKAKLIISTQGVRGGKVSDYKLIGWMCLAINDEGGWRNERIDIDSFKGFGESYTIRETPEIRIWSNAEVVFQGTYSDLVKTIELGKTLFNSLKNVEDV
jgi:hypothetical protein